MYKQPLKKRKEILVIRQTEKKQQNCHEKIRLSIFCILFMFPVLTESKQGSIF